MATTILHELDRKFDNGGTDNTLSFDGATLRLRIGSRDEIATVEFKIAVAHRFTDEYHMALGFGGSGKLLEQTGTEWLEWANQMADEIFLPRGGRIFRTRHFDIYLESWGRLEVIADGIELTFEDRTP
ncbi:MAG TPA: hypothetical protein VMY41_12110 [Thermohalobaculum sp.]|nr:hypothetical protein [Thermohalobaculum sp.]